MLAGDYGQKGGVDATSTSFEPAAPPGGSRKSSLSAAAQTAARKRHQSGTVDPELTFRPSMNARSKRMALDRPSLAERARGGGRKGGVGASASFVSDGSAVSSASAARRVSALKGYEECTFQPRINAKSARMTAAREEDTYEYMGALRTEHMYRKGQELEEKRKALRRKAEREFAANHPFAPQISSRHRSGRADMSSRSELTEDDRSFEERNREWLAARDARRAALAQQKEDPDAEELTFRPAINSARRGRAGGKKRQKTKTPISKRRREIVTTIAVTSEAHDAGADDEYEYHYEYESEDGEGEGEGEEGEGEEGEGEEDEGEEGEGWEGEEGARGQVQARGQARGQASGQGLGQATRGQATRGQATRGQATRGQAPQGRGRGRGRGQKDGRRKAEKEVPPAAMDKFVARMKKARKLRAEKEARVRGKTVKAKRTRTGEIQPEPFQFMHRNKEAERARALAKSKAPAEVIDTLRVPASERHQYEYEYEYEYE